MNVPPFDFCMTILLPLRYGRFGFAGSGAEPRSGPSNDTLSGRTPLSITPMTTPLPALAGPLKALFQRPSAAAVSGLSDSRRKSTGLRVVVRGRSCGWCPWRRTRRRAWPRAPRPVPATARPRTRSARPHSWCPRWRPTDAATACCSDSSTRAYSWAGALSASSVSPVSGLVAGMPASPPSYVATGALVMVTMYRPGMTAPASPGDSRRGRPDDQPRRPPPPEAPRAPRAPLSPAAVRGPAARRRRLQPDRRAAASSSMTGAPTDRRSHPST